jgi:hypothetical protein
MHQAPNGDRSRQLWHLVLTAIEAGLDPPTVHAVAIRHQPSIDKYGERLGSEVDRILTKIGIEE